MGREAHVMALRAAAKVAFAMGLTGCGGSTESSAPPEGAKGGGSPGEDPTYTNASGEAEAAAESAYGRPGRRRPGQGTKPRFVCEGSILTYQTQEQCCRNVVQHAIPDGGSFWDPDAPKPSNDVSRCCEILVTDSDARIANGGWDDPERMPWEMVSFCCNVTPRTGPTCTPWGPPMPPAMRWGATRGIA